jgi:hypothetical protein
LLAGLVGPLVIQCAFFLVAALLVLVVGGAKRANAVRSDASVSSNAP